MALDTRDDTTRCPVWLPTCVCHSRRHLTVDAAARARRRIYGRGQERVGHHLWSPVTDDV